MGDHVSCNMNNILLQAFSKARDTDDEEFLLNARKRFMVLSFN